MHAAEGKQPQKAWSEQDGESLMHGADTSDKDRNHGVRPVR